MNKVGTLKLPSSINPIFDVEFDGWPYWKGKLTNFIECIKSSEYFFCLWSCSLINWPKSMALEVSGDLGPPWDLTPRISQKVLEWDIWVVMVASIFVLRILTYPYILLSLRSKLLYWSNQKLSHAKRSISVLALIVFNGESPCSFTHVMERSFVPIRGNTKWKIGNN